MSEITKLVPREMVRLDHDRVHELCLQLGVSEAENVVCRAMEDMAERLTQIAHMSHHTSLVEMHKAVRRLVAVSGQVGMTTLANVAKDVMVCIDNGDGVALGATRDRLLRVGKKSLSALWETQDLSV